MLFSTILSPVGLFTGRAHLFLWFICFLKSFPVFQWGDLIISLKKVIKEAAVEGTYRTYYGRSLAAVLVGETGTAIIKVTGNGMDTDLTLK